MAQIKALAFDVFGTLVDWRSGVAREAAAVLGQKGLAIDFGDFADRWRARYQPAMEQVRLGGRPFVPLEVLHRENLEAVLAELGIGGLAAPELGRLNGAWRRLDPWPDVRAGMARLKRRFVLASLSNGNVALIVAMARRAGLAWEVVLGAEVARAYKPDPEAYDGAARLLGLEPAECLMVAAHPADLEAAARRGFRTAYIHRPLEYGPGRAPRRPEAGRFDLAVEDLGELAERLGA